MEDKRPKVGSAVLVEKDGKFLLGERNKENYNGYWVIPGGGVNWGETLKDAGAREIKEETGLDVEITKLIGWKEIMNLPGNYHTVVFFHLARLRDQKAELKPGDDLSKAGFFSIEEIKKMKAAESVKWVLQQAGFWK